MEPDSIKRLIVTVVGVALVTLNGKFGLGLTDAGIATIGAMIASFVVGSNLKAMSEAKAAGVAAAAGVTADTGAVAVLRGPTP